MHAKLLVFLLAFLVATPTDFQAAEAPMARLLRVSLLEGDVTYQRSDLDRWIDLSINTPVMEGDKIWVGRGGRAEVEFENGTFARLSENTIIDFSRLADINSREGVEVRLIQGLASFEVRPEPAFTIQTPLFSARLNDAASFRVDVETDGSGRLVVFDGRVEVSGSRTRLFVRKGELVRFLSQDADRYYLETNYIKDGWDRWNDERQDYLTKITQERFHYGDRGWATADLYNYGSWYDVPAYGRVWRPATVETDWVPFRSGRWVWYSSFGWT
ncbi:MAG: FecR domain-containing protein, partial [Terriglobia bacterium]